MGHISLDTIIYPENELEEEKSTVATSISKPGGAATSTAMVLSGFDIIDNVYLAGSVGNDHNGTMVQNMLEENNIQLAIQPFDNYKTTKNRAIVYENKKPMYCHENPKVADYKHTDVDDSIWSDLNHLHISTNNTKKAYNFVKKAKKHDITISFNPTQGYEQNDFSQFIKLFDLIQLNEEEWRIFKDRNDKSEFTDVDIVVTKGKSGAVMYTKNNTIKHKGYSDNVANFEDSIGAGDSTVAGLLTQWINNEEPEKCIAVANACGSLSVQYKGSPKNISEKQIRDILNDEYMNLKI